MRGVALGFLGLHHLILVDHVEPTVCFIMLVHEHVERLQLRQFGEVFPHQAVRLSVHEWDLSQETPSNTSSFSSLDSVAADNTFHTSLLLALLDGQAIGEPSHMLVPLQVSPTSEAHAPALTDDQWVNAIDH